MKTSMGSYDLTSSRKSKKEEELVDSRSIMDDCARTHRTMLTRSIVFIFWALTLSFIGCTLSGKIPPRRLPFPCDREKVTVRRFEEDTISAGVLFASLFLAPVIVFVVVESFIDAEEEFRSGFRRSCCVFNDFFSGFFYVFTITEVLKLLVSEQRPHFFYTCKPDWETMVCTNGQAIEYNCTGEGPWWLVQVDIYKSFPSGHSSLSFYTFVFVSMYVQLRVSSTKSVMEFIRPWIQLFFLCWTLACCFTRITDNRHYWWDVLSGVIIGSIIALYMVKFSKCKTFSDFACSGKNKAESKSRDPETTPIKASIIPE